MSAKINHWCKRFEILQSIKLARLESLRRQRCMDHHLDDGWGQPNDPLDASTQKTIDMGGKRVVRQRRGGRPLAEYP